MPNTMSDSDIITKYLMSLLSPEQKEELNQLLGKSNTVSADPDDIVEDAFKGRISMDRLPPRLKRVANARTAPDRSTRDTSFNERFPDAVRIRQG